MNNASKKKIIDRAIEFIKCNTPQSKLRMAGATIAELELVKSVDLADVGGSLPTQDEIKEEAEKLYKSMMNGTFEDIRQAKTSQLMFLSGAWFARGFKKQ